MAMTPSSRFTFSPLLGGLFIAITAVYCLLTALFLTAMPISRIPIPVAGEANLTILGFFWVISGLSWLTLTMLWWMIWKKGDGDLSAAMGRGKTTLIILAIACFARLIVLFGNNPVLSDDIYRYVFDGRNLAHAVNPYSASPQERKEILDEGGRENFPGETALLRRLNNPEMPTIYLPASQGVFAFIGWVMPDSITDPDSAARWFRGLFILIELGLMILLAGALARASRSPWWLALYAWHPLPLTEIAGSGHQDILGIFLLVVSLLVWNRCPAKVWRWTIPLALAALVKPFVLPLALIFLRGKPLKQWIASLVIGGVTCAIVTAPLLLTHDRQPLRNLAETSSRFSLKWAHFGSVYEPVLWTIEKATNPPDAANLQPEDPSLWTNDRQERLARLICAALILGVIIITIIRVHDPWVAARIFLFALVLFSPTAHPWYLLWALALFPRVPSPALWVCSFTILLGYAQLGDVIDWSMSPWVMVVAYAPVYAALLYDLTIGKRTPPDTANHP